MRPLARICSAGVALSLAVLPLLAQAGHEEDEERAELVQPTNTVELGAGTQSANRSGYGRMLGLGRGETSLLANVDLRGGGAYPSDDATRWRFALSTGFDQGRLSAEYGVQGTYRLRFAYSDFSTLQSDTYQTPLLGVGGSQLTLPGALTARTARGPSDLPGIASAFSRFDIGSQRRIGELSAESALNGFWSIKAGYRHELRDGLKLTGAVSGSVGNSALFVPEPIHTTTDQFNLALAYAADRRHLQFSYSGSLFRNAVDSVTFQNPFSAGLLNNRLASAPDNQYHQLKLDGAANLSTTTRLSGALGIGRMTQDQSFLPYSTASTTALPQSSLHGVVMTRNASLKLTSRPWRDLSLLASYRYDARDNQTPVALYRREGAEFGKADTVGVLNHPYSRQRSKATLESDYLVRRDAHLALGLDREAVQRNCHQLGEACTEVERSVEYTLRGEWRQDFYERLSGKLGLSRAERRADRYSVLDTATELAGMRKFLYADRDRNQVRASLTAQVSEALAVTARVDANEDQYRQSRFGLQSSSSTVSTVDASLAVHDEFSLYAFYTRQDIRSRLDSRYSALTEITNAVLPNQEWQLRMQDVVDAVGLGFKHSGLYSGRLEWSADLIWLGSVSRYHMAGGSKVSSASSPNLPTSLPDVSSRHYSLRSDVRYQLDRASSLRLVGQFNHVRSKDYAYEGITATSSTRILGTNESPLNVDGHTLVLSYLYRFR